MDQKGTSGLLGRSKDDELDELFRIYEPVRSKLIERLLDFRRIWASASDEDLFIELVFCLLTPQSKAKTCWKAVLRLSRKDLIETGDAPMVQADLTGVRFCNRKAEYICMARDRFRDRSIRQVIESFKSPFEAREWFVENVMGLGYKEASHFLRNIGIGEELAILDRHILKNLVRLGVIDAVPKSLAKKSYLDIERRMREFSVKSGIPMGQLDLLLWYREAGEIFK
jgi:N-glycosylase/DNA lyase